MTDMIQQNIRGYESPEIVMHYSRLSDLVPPERTILGILREKLYDMKMLDLGVGGGRTTRFFAPLVKSYVGVDWSGRMVEACRKKYPHYSFRIDDARTLQFDEGEFDFVLFSYNGLDYIGHEDRLKALDEIHRVLRSGGYFVFSSHNLDYAPRLLRRRYFWSRRAWVERHDDYAILNDGSHGSKLLTYYARPTEVRRQLLDQGFDDVRAFALDGSELCHPRDARKDGWLYYLAERSKA
jgi:SAM-dependent methyltransferase